MPSEETILCPLCGKVVPSDVQKCPFCNSSIDRIKLRREIDKVIERRIMRRLKAKAEKEVEAPAVPSAPLPDMKMTCPGCSMELAGHETKCSRCGIPLLDEKEMLECPECSARFAPGTAKCPECGVSFASEEAEPPPPEEPAPAPRHAPRHAPGPPAEHVTPAIHPEPELAGRGLTNGRGAINGTGLVNGTGIINGGGVRHGHPRRRGFAVARWQFLAVLVALVIIIPTFIYMSYSSDDEGYSIDGRFRDWSGSDMYTVELLTTTPLTYVQNWAVGIDGTRVFVYVEAAGNIMATSSVESVFLFVDSDDDPGSGYVAGALGADFMIELDGWNGTVQSSSVFQYDSSEDQHDWNSWRSIGGAVCRLEGRQLEAMGNVQLAPSQDAKFLLSYQDQMYRRAVSATVPAEGGVLVVTQRLSDSAPLSGVLPASATAPMLTLEFRCDGVDGTVDAVEVQKSGFSSMVGEAGGFSLQVGEVEVRHLMADLSAVSPGELVTAYVTSTGVQSSFASVIVTGHPARAYVGSAPEGVHIDGAFGDWYGRTASDVDLVDVSNANVDVSEVGVFNTSAQAAFFVGVAGEMLSGSYVPVVKGKPVQGTDGGPVVPMRKTAEDITWIFIDSDMSVATGYPMSADSKTIGADYRIEVRGVQGMVVSSRLYQYTGSSWSLLSTGAPAEVDFHRLEVSVPASAIGGQAALDFIIQTTDWRGVGDYVSLDEATMLALTEGISLSVGTNAWAVASSVTSATATASSFQRKLFYDGTNFWSFYFDGSNTVYKYSSDGGANWNYVGAAFSTAGVAYASIWHEDGKVYIVGDTSSATTYVHVRRGVVDSVTPAITWGNEAQVSISSNALASKQASICRDPAGQVWVGGPSYSGLVGGLDRYQLRASESQYTDDVEGTWLDRGNILSGTLPTTTSKLCLVPGTSSSGIEVWGIYSSAGGVYSKAYSGGWSAGTTTIYSPGASTENTERAPASAATDSNGVVHVVYGTGNVDGGWKAHIQYVYNSGSGWSTPIWLNESVTAPFPVRKSPTISLDSATGDVYAMWLEEGSQNPLKVKKNVGGSWSFVSVSTTAFSKDYLTSIYSAPGGSLVCMQWTEDISPGDYQVVFERIPEFSDAALPVLFLLTIFIVMHRRRSRDKRET